MLSHLNSIFRVMLLLIFVSGLVACGGGGGGGDVPAVAVDSTPPKVIKTIPGSEDENISPGTAISITFSENIVKPLRTDIEIYPVELNVANKNKPVEFQFSYSANTLIIEPNTGALSTKAIYEVTISKVKDTADNVLVKSCTWIFATEGAATIRTGATGVCGTKPPQGPASAPQNIKAEVIDSTTVKVSWQAPLSGETPSFYQVARSIDSGSYTTVADRETTLTFTDRNAQTDKPHIYKVTAGNDVTGLSKEFDYSNEVIPKTNITFQNLRVTLAGLGMVRGQVTSAPNGIDCGTICTKDFAENTTVILTASTTDQTSIFKNWTGDCVDASTNVVATVTMLTSITCTANFIKPLYVIGDPGPAGGTVFYISDVGGLHGLEAAPVDQTGASWGCLGMDIRGAIGSAIGTGAQNTAAIIAAGCTEAGTAAKLAVAYVLNGNTGWFLPSIDEARELFLQKAVLSNLSATDFYWTSTQQSSSGMDYSLIMALFSGRGGSSIKSGLYRIRVIRAF